MDTYDDWKTRDDTPLDHEDAKDADYLVYQVQVAFEDLAAAIGFDRAVAVTVHEMLEHGKMLVRQGRLRISQ